MTKQSWRNLPSLQLLQPRTMRFADSEITATLLGIPPIGEYVPDVETKWDEDGAILNADVWRRIQAFTDTMTAPPIRGREWAQRVAGEAIDENVTQQKRK